MLRLSGRYQTVGFVFNGHLRKQNNFDQGFDLYDIPRLDFALPFSERHESARRIYEKTEKFLKNKDSRPLFLYLHYMDVHIPYAPPGSVAKMFLEEKYHPYIEILQERLLFLREEKDRYIALYDAEIRYTDYYLQKLFELLKKHGISSDNSIILITADHGEEFYEHGHQGHSKTLYNELIHVPLILSVPSQKHRGTVIQSYVQLIDLAPTILDLLSIDWGKYHQFQGRSIQSWLQGGKESSNEILAGGSCDRVAVIEGDWKYYRSYNRCSKPEEGVNEWLFHLATDPQERINLIDQEKEIAQRLRKRSTALMQHFLGAKASSVELDPETREELKALGY